MEALRQQSQSDADTYLDDRLALFDAIWNLGLTGEVIEPGLVGEHETRFLSLLEWRRDNPQASDSWKQRAYEFMQLVDPQAVLPMLMRCGPIANTMRLPFLISVLVHRGMRLTPDQAVDLAIDMGFTNAEALRNAFQRALAETQAKVLTETTPIPTAVSRRVRL